MQENQIFDLSGKCSCGAVSIQAKAPKTYGVCHCNTCRRWSGGVWMGVATIQAPIIQGPIKIWKSSAIADRATCEQCGSAIWYRPAKSKKPVLGQGLFDDQEDWQMNRQLFGDMKPSHYNFSDTNLVLSGWGTFIAILFGKMPK